MTEMKNKYVLYLETGYKFNVEDWIEVGTTEKKSETFIYQEYIDDDDEVESLKKLRE